MTLKLGKPISRDWSLNLRQKSYHLDPTYLAWISGRRAGEDSVIWPASPTLVSHVGGGSETESNLVDCHGQTGVIA